MHWIPAVGFEPMGLEFSDVTAQATSIVEETPVFIEVSKVGEVLHRALRPCRVIAVRWRAMLRCSFWVNWRSRF